MCTVKKDFVIPDAIASAPAVASSHDYDQMNRKQSQFLLDMIYASSKQTSPSLALEAAVDDQRAIREELAAVKRTVVDLQASIARLPQQIVSALLESRLAPEVMSDDEDFEVEDDEDLEYDKLPSLDGGFASSARTVSTSSSDVFVLKRFAGSLEASPPKVDISKEMQHLAARFKAISIPPASTTSSAPSLAPPPSPHFSYWEARYQSSKAKDNAVPRAAPIGNIRLASTPRPQGCKQEATIWLSPSACPANLEAPQVDSIPKILPYNPSIDLNMWLK